MSAFDQAIRAYRVEVVMKAVLNANGHFSAAARNLGVHRNLVSRVLSSAGYSSRRVKEMVRRHQAVMGRKPMGSARPAIEAFELEAARPVGRTANPVVRRSA